LFNCLFGVRHTRKGSLIDKGEANKTKKEIKGDGLFGHRMCPNMIVDQQHKFGGICGLRPHR